MRNERDMGNWLDGKIEKQVRKWEKMFEDRKKSERYELHKIG